jgi:hypothetical protein
MSCGGDVGRELLNDMCVREYEKEERIKVKLRIKNGTRKTNGRQ